METRSRAPLSKLYALSQRPKFRIGTDITSIARHEKLLVKALKRAGYHKKDPSTLQRLLASLPHRLSSWEIPLLTFRMRQLHDTDDPSKQDPRQITAIASWLAGRWAAKEAAIKALFPRVVNGSNVVILPNSIYERLSSLGEDAVWQGPDSEPIARFTFDEMTAAKFDQPVLLIRPETPQVLMKRHVALRRGVAVSTEKPTASLNEVPFLDPNDAGVIERRARTPLTSYSIAEVSISHDEYAVATVLAEPQEVSQQLHDPIQDDGSSDELLYDPRVYDPGAAAWAWDQPIVSKKA